MVTTFAFIELGSPEMLIILVILGMFIGGKKVADMSRAVGSSVQEMKKTSSAVGDIRKEIVEQMDEVKTNLSGVTQPKTDASHSKDVQIESDPL
jgi:sec-independent protein translocase protein TatA